MIAAPAASELALIPVPAELVGREISVRILLPLWHAARVHGLDFERLIADVSCDRAQLTDARQRVSWDTYTRIVSNFGTQLDDERLIASGAISLQSPIFRAMLIPGRLLFGVADAYRWIFSPTGRSAELVACQVGVMSEVAPDHLRLEVCLRPGYAPSRENYLMLQGLLTGVSWALGAGHAQVTQQALGRGALYDIRIPPARGAIRATREAFSWISAARSAGHELERAHAELHERYVELQREIEARAQLETERQRLEEQLRHAQKMDAVGRLAGGIAHDFNNLLSVILSYSQLILQERGADAATRHRVEEIQKAGQRAANLTTQLLAFSRREIVQPRALDLNQIIADMHGMLRRLVGDDIELASVSCDELAKVKADRGHLEQVIMNLIVNARDAMPMGGRITLETANVELDEQYAKDHLGVTPGPHVMLAVSDTGVGMDAATQARVFEPFFTTKEQGKGTGLGLSTVFGIVKQASGSVWLNSEPGRGTTFKIYFPATDDREHESKGLPSRGSTAGTETILLVDDQDEVRAVTRIILEDNGYHILEAANGADALRICEQHPGQIDLLLTDVVMPKMSGRELAERVLQLRPTIKTMYMSGYTEDSVVRHGVLGAELVFLQKPVTPDVLLSKVRATLG